MRGSTSPKSVYSGIRMQGSRERRLRQTLSMRNVTAYAWRGVRPRNHFLMKCAGSVLICSSALTTPVRPCVTVSRRTW